MLLCLQPYFSTYLTLLALYSPFRTPTFITYSRNVLIILQSLISNKKKTIVFLWTSSLIGELNHDETYQAVKNAISYPKVTNNLHQTHTDLKQYYNVLNKQWFRIWKNLKFNNKLRQIKELTINWSSSNRRLCRE